MMKTLISWNVNGIRAIQKKGFVDWLHKVSPDILCVQETKANPDQLDEALLQPDGYRALWVSAERKGYSGVAAFVRDEPETVCDLGTPEFDTEGRTMILTYPEFTLFNCYFPNSQPQGARIDYKVAYCNAVMEACDERVARGENIIVCGDFNIAHNPIDLENPKANEQNPGYLPEEREWMDKFIGGGYVDTFRMFCDAPGRYTWWSYRFKAREKNVGWRIDYHCVNESFRDRVQLAEILGDVMGSDHCPVRLTVK
jgi:exodeoxyribonuclease-3